jgi:hypothetical protein
MNVKGAGRSRQKDSPAVPSLVTFVSRFCRGQGWVIGLAAKPIAKRARLNSHVDCRTMYLSFGFTVSINIEIISF